MNKLSKRYRDTIAKCLAIDDFIGLMYEISRNNIKVFIKEDDKNNVYLLFKKEDDKRDEPVFLAKNEHIEDYDYVVSIK